ncbi:MAG TPA: ACT domain-containing protein [Solirubrobacterales bacterium]|nr:ACT domain-containing protein [Solirubrobacterales bacterium]
MPEFAVTAIGRDRPGIVAAISGALLELEGNIEDSQMSILRGHFAVVLLVKLPDSLGAGELDRRLGRVRENLDLEAIAVNAVDDLDVAATRPSHVITVYGADHPGIVNAVSTALAGRAVNITGLETRLAGPPESPLYVMIIEAALGEVPEEELRGELREVAENAGVEVAVRELEAEAL